ncbi:ClpP/crotonase [Cylindrobasidium torrendii FP15055 ss-10]|uniref:3-hydroxyisobutyryl-CoA hydrolase n=1 Tax=Cylindrobasidium torrendii FP15055 ss-10 TaxID=1314674 RepID=A0A0D7B5L9_9AGAR|nr:ClpP/crotonase [Cylindrobasidium torrendii FP15055 ss-10]
MLRLTVISGMSKPGARAAQRTQAIGRHMMSTLSKTEDSVTFHSRGEMRIFKLNRPEKLNALNEEMIDLIRPKITGWRDSKAAGFIVSMGEGRAFCSGGDIFAVADSTTREETKHQGPAYFKKEFELDYLLATLSKPYVAIMDGITMGGGVGLSSGAHFRIVTDNTMWAMPETNIGYTPDVGATHWLLQLDGEIGTYLALTGERISGREVMNVGLATHYMPPSRIPAFLDALAEVDRIHAPKPVKKAPLSPLDAALVKASMSTSTSVEDVADNNEPSVTKTEEQDSQEEAEASNARELYFNAVRNVVLEYSEPAAKYESLFSGHLRVALDGAFSQKSVEAIMEYLEKLTANPSDVVAQWATKTLKTLKSRSPTSLKVTLQALRNARSSEKKLLPRLQEELAVASAFCNGASPDFVEGVTKAVGPKDKRGAPSWSPASVNEVSQEILDRFFKPDSPYRKSTPTLGFTKLQHASLSQYESGYNTFGLPSDADVKKLVEGASTDSTGSALTEREVLLAVVNQFGDRPEVVGKAWEVLQRNCEAIVSSGLGADGSPYLTWKPKTLQDYDERAVKGLSTDSW